MIFDKYTESIHAGNDSATRIVGIDPGYRNTGIAIGGIGIASSHTYIESIGLVQTKSIKCETKTNEKARCVGEIGRFYHEHSESIGWSHVAGEIPGGAQSYSAASALGVATGTLAMPASTGKTFTPVTPQAVKKKAIALFGGSGKKDIVDGMMELHASLDWPVRTLKGRSVPVYGKCEHMADAALVLYVLAEHIRTVRHNRHVTSHRGYTRADTKEIRL